MPPINDDLERNGELERLAGLSEAFCRAVEGRHYFSDAGAAEKAFAALKEGELDSWGELAQEIFDMRAEFSRSGQKPGKEYMEKVIRYADTMADIVTRVVPAESVAESLPNDMKSDAGVQQLRLFGAGNLAKLCTLKRE